MVPILAGINWEKDKRRQQRAASRPKRPLQPTDKILQVLRWFKQNPEEHAGNWVLLPREWDAALDQGSPAHIFRAHRTKACLVKRADSPLRTGDQIARVSDEIVDSLGLSYCPECAGFKPSAR